MSNTITILKKLPNQKIGRPFGRADNLAEMKEIIEGFWQYHSNRRPLHFHTENLNTEKAVATVITRTGETASFYAFDESVLS